ncbi:hypothetical protein L9F63_007565, partial [Diploptera punctata]
MNITGELLEHGSHIYFGVIDYTLFGLMLLFSALIGVYFGCFEKKLDSRVDYLFGGKTMKTLPVAVSLVASHFSGITLIAIPSEVFYYGMLYWLVNVSSVVVTVMINYVYLPIFYKLQLTSTYEYLEMRFNRNARTMASLLFTIHLLLYIPLVIYMPALAFSYVSGLSVHIITPLCCIICIFYTMLGGLKAVVWIDFLQSFVIMISCIVIIIIGLIHAGGFYERLEQNCSRAEFAPFHMDPSPFVRVTFWNVIIGNIFSWLNYCAVNQGMVQKFLALPSFAKAQQSLILFTIGIFIIKTISCFTGMIVFTTYYDCDPIKNKVITKQDQLIPYYIMDIAASIPGLPGLFIAGVFSAALSSMSTNLNSLGATMYEDFIQPCIRKKISEKTVSYIIRFLVVMIGVFSVLMVFVVERLGAVIQLAYTMGGVTSGAFLGLFSLGMFFPRANSKGAMAGAIVSLLSLAWIAVGAQNALGRGNMKYRPLHTNVEGCSNFNGTIPEMPEETHKLDEDVFVLFRVSFMYYTMMGTFILIVVAVVVSLLTEADDPKIMNPDLYAPFLRNYVMRLRKEAGADESAEREMLNNPDKKNESSLESINRSGNFLTECTL